MDNRKLKASLGALILAIALPWEIDPAISAPTQNSRTDLPPGQAKRITPADRQAAADRAAAQGLVMPLPGTMEMAIPGTAPHYFSVPNYANSPLPTIDATTGTIAGGIKKFVDTLPGLGSDHANNLGQYIPVAVPDTETYPGSDYYEIALVEFTEQMHSNLPATKLRGYVQLETQAVQGNHHALAGGVLAVDKPHYLGPMIAARKDRPVRILFRNLLPAGQGGKLFMPVDTTVMGSGMGPGMFDPATGEMMAEPDPQNPMCGSMEKPAGCFTENRATLHLHGGITPWISDGTPHQWITPADEFTPYAKGVSVRDVPDMAASEPGQTTFYWTNQQSARLMFYHDHAWGITRLNVYAGEAAPYLITDPTEERLVADGILPADQIPLIIQDKTFVPPLEQLELQDPLWDIASWGGTGSLWVPHVYSPAQNPGDASGVNQFGRWAYGPWFWPPTASIKHGPLPNPYYDAACDPDATWCEPPLMPGVPFLSMGMESFNDTPVVNGTAYPTLTVDAKSYRLRILNGANDRFFNLSWYVADETGTEVALNAAEVAAALVDPAGVFPTPDTSISPPGPDWIQVGTEGGFLPTPVLIPAQPTTWVTDPTVFNAGNVDKHSLLIAPAERADVVVDFSAYAGQTLILYNDAPAAFPARDPRYDYYAGNPDLRTTGGAQPTLPGYGPNTRTVMQVKVNANPAAPFDLAALQAAFAHQLDADGNPAGVFESSQHPIIVGQAAYNEAYGTPFRTTDGLVRIFDTSFSFKTLTGGTITIPLQPKQIQDEMGEAFERDYGRMGGFLGVETPNRQAGLQNMILYPFTSPPTEIVSGIELPEGVKATPIASADDGTQIWKITHNGVDTHPIHFHLYDVQLINRVGWDGIIRRPDLNELGWKDTVRVSPLEDTIVALRPIIPRVPFDLPNSVRLLDPSMPEGATLASSTQAELNGQPLFAFDPKGEPIDIVNHYVNFGWEYVWHCHILSHEEMDMMRSVAVAVAPRPPSELTANLTGNGNNRRVVLNWTDGSLNETGFTVQRATNATFATGLTTFTLGADTTTYTDPIGNTKQAYYYRVFASNTVGDTWDYTDPNLNNGASFPTRTAVSGFSSTAGVNLPPPPPLAPGSVSAVASRFNTNNDRVTLSWADNATNETGFTIQRATNAAFTTGLVNSTVGANVTTFTTGNVPRNTALYFRIHSFNAGGMSEDVNAAPFPVITP